MHVPEHSAMDVARAAFKQARDELEYFGASEDFTRSPLEAAIEAYLDHSRGAVSADPTERWWAAHPLGHEVEVVAAARVEQLEAAIREHRAACLHPKEDHIHVQADANEDLWLVLDV